MSLYDWPFPRPWPAPTAEDRAREISWDAVLQGLLPVEAERAELRYVRNKPVAEKEGWLVATLMLITWDKEWDKEWHKEWEGRTVSNILKQEVWLLPSSGCPDRIVRYLEAWAAGLPDVLRNIRATNVPGDFTDFREHPLELSTRSTVEDFEAALRTKGRLGRWL